MMKKKGRNHVKGMGKKNRVKGMGKGKKRGVRRRAAKRKMMMS